MAARRRPRRSRRNDALRPTSSDGGAAGEFGRGPRSRRRRDLPARSRRPRVSAATSRRLLLDLAGAVPQRSYRYLFHHMPKAAGTSCRQVFADWFAVTDDDRVTMEPGTPPPPLDLASIGLEDADLRPFQQRRTPAARPLSCRARRSLLAPDHLPARPARDGPVLPCLRARASTEGRSRPSARCDIDALSGNVPGPSRRALRSDRLTIGASPWTATGSSAPLDRMDEGLRWLADSFGRTAPEQIAHLNRRIGPTDRPTRLSAPLSDATPRSS